MARKLPTMPAPLPEDKNEEKRLFAQEYFKNGYDAVKAYMTVKPNVAESTAKLKGKELLNNYLVRKELDRLSMDAMSKIEDDVPRIALELKTMAYLDPIHLFTEGGDLRPLSEIPEAARRALAGIEINAMFDNEGNVIGHTKKIKLNDKGKALRMLGEWKKMFTNKTEIGIGEDMATLIHEARKRYKEGIKDDADIVEAEVVEDEALGFLEG